VPVDFCLVPGTRIGYIFLPHLGDETIPGQVRDALRAMTAPGPLDGLILDNRLNGGGASPVLEALLGLFTEGTPGYFVSRDDARPLEIEAEDVGGSQAVPLVVLVEVETASYGEVLSGVLGESGRATLIGQTTFGNVETLWAFGFEDGSRAWIAREAFQFADQAVGEWEDTGIVPDIVVPTRWDLFTEANDPAMAAALDVLLGQQQSTRSGSLGPQGRSPRQGSSERIETQLTEASPLRAIPQTGRIVPTTAIIGRRGRLGRSYLAAAES
jgi:carboxyl-terminal processing protease